MKFLLDTRGDEINRKWHPEFVSGQLLQAVPEPGTWAVLAVVCIGAALWRAKR